MKILLTFAILYGCFIAKADTLSYLGSLQPEYVKNYNKPVPKNATKFIRRIDSTFRLYPLNAKDSLVQNYNFSQELKFYSYSMTHKYKGVDVEVSGLIIQPTTKKVDLDIIYFHGTYLPIKVLPTPSKFKLKKNGKKAFFEAGNMMMLADQGYTVFVPDYIGYSTSDNVEHPYTVLEPNVESAYKWYAASKEQKDAVSKAKELVITGVSEGAGYALAFHKYMEDNSSPYQVKKSYVCSGPYDYQTTLNWIFEGGDKTSLGMIMYTWSAYSQLQYYYPESSLKDEMFKIKNIKQRKLFKIKRLLPKTSHPTKYVEEEYIKKLLNREIEEFKVIDEKTSVYKGWTPKSDVHLFHGQYDQILTNENSTKVYEEIKSEKVELHMVPNKGHVNITDTYFGFIILDLAKG